MTLADKVFWGVFFLGWALDGVLLWRGGHPATISWNIARYSQKYPIIAFAFGCVGVGVADHLTFSQPSYVLLACAFLCGHFFFPNREYCEYRTE